MSTDWRERAGCRNLDPELFYPGRNDDKAERVAKAICSHCPVIAECREYVLDFEAGHGLDMLYGVWAGMSAADRRRVLLERRSRKRVRS